MSAAENPSPTTAETKPSRSGRLLALVRKLIDYGRELAATIRERVAAEPIFARTRFGTADLEVILARIAHGLQLAQALEARVLSRAAALDKGPRPPRARSAPRPEPSASPPAETTEPCLAGLPTAEQIAAEVRRRPIGAVIAEIYYNLGLMPSDPLWREVHEAMLRFGGSFVRLFRDILDRVYPRAARLLSANKRARSPGLSLQPDAPSGTGPP